MAKFAALLCAVIIGPNCARAQQPSGQEKFLFDAVNRERAERKMPPLKWDAALAEAARRHTAQMVQNKTLSHQLEGEASLEQRVHQTGARFSRLAENIGEAPEVAELHSGWMESPRHAANILNPLFTSVGIAVEESGKQFFATQDFSAAVPELSVGEQEEMVGKQIQAHGLRVSLGSSEARRECESPGRYHDTAPKAVTHFETPDLDRLPEGLQKVIATGHYRSAAVGACQPGDAGGFTRFRLAVLFY